MSKKRNEENMINLKIKPQRPAIIRGYDNEIYALVKASAEEGKAETESLPLNLAIVIDRSGSMAGAPLEEAKKSAAYIVSKMREIDRIAIVVYLKPHHLKDSISFPIYFCHRRYNRLLKAFFVSVY